MSSTEPSSRSSAAPWPAQAELEQRRALTRSSAPTDVAPLVATSACSSRSVLTRLLLVAADSVDRGQVREVPARPGCPSVAREPPALLGRRVGEVEPAHGPSAARLHLQSASGSVVTSARSRAIRTARLREREAIAQLTGAARAFRRPEQMRGLSRPLREFDRPLATALRASEVARHVRRGARSMWPR